MQFDLTVSFMLNATMELWQRPGNIPFTSAEDILFRSKKKEIICVRNKTCETPSILGNQIDDEIMKNTSVS